jgi:hypothetical protein
VLELLVAEQFALKAEPKLLRCAPGHQFCSQHSQVLPMSPGKRPCGHSKSARGLSWSAHVREGSSVNTCTTCTVGTIWAEAPCVGTGLLLSVGGAARPRSDNCAVSAAQGFCQGIGASGGAGRSLAGRGSLTGSRSGASS